MPNPIGPLPLSMFVISVLFCMYGLVKLFTLRKKYYLGYIVIFTLFALYIAFAPQIVAWERDIFTRIGIDTDNHLLVIRIVLLIIVLPAIIYLCSPLIRYSRWKRKG